MSTIRKALVMSVGTGVGEAGVGSLVNAIVFSINNHNPDRIFFVVTKESQRDTLPRITSQITTPWEPVVLADPDNINKIYEELSNPFRNIIQQFNWVTVDYTSGTKAMSAVLAILGCLYQVNTISYISGHRERGVVVRGTERVESLFPFQFFADKRFQEAIVLFNRCQFESCLLLISQIESRCPQPAILSHIEPFKRVAHAYAAWDKFDHQQAWDNLKSLKLSALDGNKAFLGRLHHSRERGEEVEPFYIADLVNNAQRRGDVEHKYDDAVARLYRVIELIAQHRLKKYGIASTSDVPPQAIPPALADELKPSAGGKIRLGLEKAYRLLEHNGDELGKAFTRDARLRDLLQKRNSSIYAHGLEPVTEQTYRGLLEKARHLASSLISNFDELASQSKFIQWSHSQ